MLTYIINSKLILNAFAPDLQLFYQKFRTSRDLLLLVTDSFTNELLPRNDKQRFKITLRVKFVSHELILAES